MKLVRCQFATTCKKRCQLNVKKLHQNNKKSVFCHKQNLTIELVEVD